MTPDVRLTIDGVPHTVPGDITLAAALLNADVHAFRRDLDGDARAPVCGMGSCFECRVTVDGIPNVRSCLTPVRAGMIVETSE